MKGKVEFGSSTLVNPSQELWGRGDKCKGPCLGKKKLNKKSLQANNNSHSLIAGKNGWILAKGWVRNRETNSNRLHFEISDLEGAARCPKSTQRPKMFRSKTRLRSSRTESSASIETVSFWTRQKLTEIIYHGTMWDHLPLSNDRDPFGLTLASL